jgi:flagellar basal-body rod protein FlgG
MLEGMYSAAAGMAAQQQRLDAVSNDIANVNTTGYKRVRVAFRDLVYTPEWLATQPGARGVTEGAGAAATTVGRGSAQGAFQRTDEPLDVGIQGQGFLRMKREDGQEILTRDGNLRFDDQGRLTSERGDLVQPPIKLPAGGDASQVKIAQNGSVTLNGTELGKLAVVTVPSVDGLEPAGDNGFIATAASGTVRAAPAGTTLEQGVLEMSNVDMGDAMTDMLESQRAYEMASKAIQAQDRQAEIANGIKR